MRRRPNRGGVERLMNSYVVGSLSAAWRRASRASSSRIGAPPNSNITRPVGTRVAQNSNAPLPFPIRVSLPLMQTGISGNTLKYTFAPLMTLIFLLRTSSAASNCLALKRTPIPFIRMPQSPKARVVPFIEPPVGIGMRPLWRLMLTIFFGASWVRVLTNTANGFR